MTEVQTPRLSVETLRDLLADADAEVRVFALGQLARWRHAASEATTQVIVCLQSTVPMEVERAAQTLAAIGSAAWPNLLEALRGGSTARNNQTEAIRVTVVCGALQAIQLQGEQPQAELPQIVATGIAALLNDSSLTVRFAATEALGNKSFAQLVLQQAGTAATIVRTLRRHIADKDPQDRTAAAACRALQLWGPGAMPLLTEVLDNPSCVQQDTSTVDAEFEQRIRCRVLDLLRKVGTGAAAPIVRRYLGEEHPQCLREKAALALQTCEQAHHASEK